MDFTEEDLEIIKTFETFLYELKNKFKIKNFPEFRKEMYEYVYSIDKTKDKEDTGLYEILSRYSGDEDAK